MSTRGVALRAIEPELKSRADLALAPLDVLELPVVPETYALALNKIRQGLCVFDGQQRLVMFNRQYAEMYGLAAEDLRLGMTLREVIDLRYAAGTGPLWRRSSMPYGGTT